MVRGKVYLCSDEGKIKRTLSVGTQIIHSIYSTSTSFACCEGSTRVVTIVKNNGEILFSKSIPGCESPINSQIDRSGCLYIVDWKANQLVRLIQDGSVKDVLLRNDILEKPHALAFSRDFSKLYIANHGTHEIFAFACKY